MTGERSAGPDRFALIIGAMKSGTTSLFEYLAAHPAVAPARVKEPHFFADADRVRGGLKAYRELWDWRPGVHQVGLEASTSYAMLPDRRGIPERVVGFADTEFRFIYIMRDPVERMASQLRHVAVRRGGGHRLVDADFDRALQYSRYSMQLDAWAARFPRETILPLLHEELVGDPKGVVDRAQRFLRVSPYPPDPETLKEVHNAGDDMRADQTLGRALNRAPWLGPLARRVPSAIRRAARRAAGRRSAEPLSLEPWRLERAVEALAPEVERLRTDWGVDTRAWRSVP